MLSFFQATDEDSVAIYLSDWLASDTVDTGQLERIHIGSCSLLSSVDLFDSLEFEAIRDYYKYPPSRCIAAYDVVFPSVNFTSMVDLTAFIREDQNEAIESVLNTYAVRYGDDYAASDWGASPPALRSSSRCSPWRGRQRDVPCDRWWRLRRGSARSFAPPRTASSPRSWRWPRTATCLRRRHPIRPVLRPGSPTSVQRRTRWRLASPTCSCTWAATSQGNPRNGHYYPGSVWLRATPV